MLMHPDLRQTWIDFVHGLLIFLILVKWFKLWVSGPFLCVYNHYRDSDWKEWLEIQMFFIQKMQVIRGVTIHRYIDISYCECQRYAYRIVGACIDTHDISSSGRNQAIKCP